ncbi:hypothetical protein F4814DRAFT_412890 [Daldinia grandis]|nr:hypothetical protein F4814DRAFT_412890 [Daldinia grandis]
MYLVDSLCLRFVLAALVVSIEPTALVWDLKLKGTCTTYTCLLCFSYDVCNTRWMTLTDNRSRTSSFLDPCFKQPEM